MFHTTKTNEEMLERQETWRNKEGFVAYFAVVVMFCFVRGRYVQTGR